MEYRTDKAEFMVGETPVEVLSEWGTCDGETFFATLINILNENGYQLDLGTGKQSASDLKDLFEYNEEECQIQGKPKLSQFSSISKFINESYNNKPKAMTPDLDQFGI